ncbi:MAG: YkgJ family cysteine cluster protein [Deltaproteobacteria bacterium]|nr:YkgJ family cysteine cluster protein [Deltaproteobacteria bacterium]
MSAHPCLLCGACCATFRVSFYRGEAIPGPGAVPEAFVVPVSPFLVAMRGTETPPPRCEQLLGRIGEEVHCAHYDLRPSPCREFAASWEDGTPNPRCDDARARHGLPPLSARDWELPPTTRKAG